MYTTTSKSKILVFATLVFVHSLVRLIIEVVELSWSIVEAIKKSTNDKYYQRCFIRVHYLRSWRNWNEFPLYSLTLIFVGSLYYQIGNNLCLTEWQWQIGALVMLLTWCELIVFLSQFQFVGVYALMFVKVLSTFIRVMTLALLLIIAFALTFYMMLSQPGYLVSSKRIVIIKQLLLILVHALL